MIKQIAIMRSNIVDSEFVSASIVKQDAEQDYIALTCTTTGAQTLNFDGLDVTGGETITVDWGDGNSNEYSGAGARSHDYAGAGTWSIKITNYLNLTTFNCGDNKLGCVAGEIGKMTNLTSLYLYSLANVTTGAGEIGALTNLTDLNLRSLANVTIGAGEIDSLVKLQTCILISSDNIAIQTAFPATIRTIRYENGLSQPNVDAVLAGLYADWATFTYATPTLDIAGDGNAAPSGVYQDGDPPTTGLEYVYELANDPETTGNNVFAITYEGGSAP